MSTAEDRREDAKRERYEERMAALPQPESKCECGGSWVLADATIYGDDADGNRGVPLYLYECVSCGNEAEVR